MNLGIIGVGKLGLVYALLFEKQGLNVFASSYKKEYVEELQQKITSTVEPGVAEMLAETQNITFTTDNHLVIDQCDMIYVMVATPSTPEGDYDVEALDAVVDDFLEHPGSVSGKILIVGSTVNPGDCQRFQEKLDSFGVDVVYCPTFVAQGTVVRDVQNPAGILFGTNRPDAADRCRTLFDYITPKNTLSIEVHPTTGEILKLATNCYSTLRISYFNQVGQMLIKSGVADDLDAATQYLNSIDRKLGNLKFGFGFGGPCYPRDNRSFSHFARRIGSEYVFGDVVDRFNRAHSDFITNWLVEDNQQHLPFFFDYISYKPGVTILEESQQFHVCQQLLDNGAHVYIQTGKFILPSTQEYLNNKYQNQVNFVDKTDLERQGISVYHVNL